MKHIHELLPPELLEQIAKPENANVVLEYMARLATHYNHNLYEDARLFWQQVQAGQIRKGFEKYPEPLNPDSWSAHDLVLHAMQENVDQAHYLTAIDKKAKEMQRIIDEQRGQIIAMSNLLDQAAAEFRQIAQLSASMKDSNSIWLIANRMQNINGGNGE